MREHERWTKQQLGHGVHSACGWAGAVVESRRASCMTWHGSWSSGWVITRPINALGNRGHGRESWAEAAQRGFRNSVFLGRVVESGVKCINGVKWHKTVFGSPEHFLGTKNYHKLPYMEARPGFRDTVFHTFSLFFRIPRQMSWIPKNYYVMSSIPHLLHRIPQRYCT